MTDSPVSSSSLRDAWSQRLLALRARDDVTAIESSLRDAQAVVCLHASHLNEYNVAASLPEEVLELLYLDTQRLCTSNDRDHQFEPPPSEWIAVTHVCSRWRQVALKLSVLWTDLHVEAYGVPWCTEMLSRMGSHPFSLSVTSHKDQSLLLHPVLRARASKQLSRLVIQFESPAAHPGAVLDSIFSQADIGASMNVRELRLACRQHSSLYWASLERFLSNLQSLSLEFIYPIGSAPSLMPALTTLSLTSVDITSHPGVPGILDFIRAMPVLESVTLTSCTFSAPIDTPTFELPPSLTHITFTPASAWSLEQNLALARLLTQTTGERIFSFPFPTPGHDLPPNMFSESVKDAVDAGFLVRELSLTFKAWRYDASVEVAKIGSDQGRPFVIRYPNLHSSYWLFFCASLEGIAMQDATLRIVYDDAPSTMLAEVNSLLQLRKFTVSVIHIAGRYSSYAAINAFMAMRQWLDSDAGTEPIGAPLPFPALREIAIENPPIDTPVNDIASMSGVNMSIHLDDCAAYLLWYARVRRNEMLKPLRTVALPTELLYKPWANELNELIEESVISYDAYMHPEEETYNTSCRTMVLYRPYWARTALWREGLRSRLSYHQFFRTTRFWERSVCVFTPVIGMIGLLWTTSRRSH
ncbi:hypothetical protein PENSPDRAFT_651145 [Peniophora sp. CONT]|nr:hypothetical protein PENSPDRAFT_651145 [Peniophora sp. CONT]